MGKSMGSGIRQQSSSFSQTMCSCGKNLISLKSGNHWAHKQGATQASRLAAGCLPPALIAGRSQVRDLCPKWGRGGYGSGNGKQLRG